MAEMNKAHTLRSPDSWSSGDPAINCWLSSGSAVVAEIIAGMRFDSLLIDRQYGPWGYKDTHAVAGWRRPGT